MSLITAKKDDDSKKQRFFLNIPNQPPEDITDTKIDLLKERILSLQNEGVITRTEAEEALKVISKKDLYLRLVEMAEERKREINPETGLPYSDLDPHDVLGIP